MGHYYLYVNRSCPQRLLFERQCPVLGFKDIRPGIGVESNYSTLAYSFQYYRTLKSSEPFDSDPVQET